MELSRVGALEAVQLGVDLQGLVRAARAVDAAAVAIVQHLYRNLAAAAPGDRACALGRVYTTASFSALDPEQAEFARRALGEAPDPAMKCLVLLASAGDQPDWNDVATSAGHRAIPRPSQAGVARLPMVAQLFRELGLDVGAFVARDPRLMVDVATNSYNVFHVEEASGSPHVPAQENFVAPYGIRSVVGFGGVLPTDELYAVIMFTRVHVPRQTAAMFRVVALSVKEALQLHLA
ncbi:MAG: hypothetical protein NVS1B16_15150 [Pseudarthrobacter sp.]